MRGLHGVNCQERSVVGEGPEEDAYVVLFLDGREEGSDHFILEGEE